MSEKIKHYRNRDHKHWKRTFWSHKRKKMYERESAPHPTNLRIFDDKIDFHKSIFQNRSN
ncbi:hypothetical protein BVX98_07390 [bacterium F11]|nr:hypothetical protein BVX98_07390 [bacterium F11]